MVTIHACDVASCNVVHGICEVNSHPFISGSDQKIAAEAYVSLYRNSWSSSHFTLKPAWNIIHEMFIPKNPNPSKNWLNLEDQNTPARKTSWNNPFHWRVQEKLRMIQKVLTLGFQTHELAWLDPQFFFRAGGTNGEPSEAETGSFFWGETTAALSMNPIKPGFLFLEI